jgi:membrane dipeptidase
MRIMKKKLILIAILIAVSIPVFASIESKSWDASEKAQEFIKSNAQFDFYAPPFGVGWTKEIQAVDYIKRAHKTGINGASLTVAATYFTNGEARAEMNRYHEIAKKYSDILTVAKTVEDIEQAIKGGKYFWMFNSQTSSILDGDIKRVKELKDLGVNSMQLVYNGRHRAGLGVVEAMDYYDIGLSAWGRALIDEMVKQGVTVDMSHTSYQTTMDIMGYMEEKHPGVPAYFTHSIPEGTYDCDATREAYHPSKNAELVNKDGYNESPCYRSISDDQIKRVAKMGGVVGVSFTEWMVDGQWPDDFAPKHGADMLDYTRKVAGIDHVAIATDDMFTTAPVVAFAKANPEAYSDGGYMMAAFNKGATGCAELAKFLPALVDELWKRGWTNEEINKAFGENIMRVWKQTWTPKSK